MKKVVSIILAAMITMLSSVSTHAAGIAGTLTLDTRSYTMAPGNIYDFRAKVDGSLRQSDVKVSDSRTGSVVKLTPLGSDKYRITGVNEGSTTVIAEINGARASISVTVKKGATQGGVAARSVTQVAEKTNVAVPIWSPDQNTSSTPAQEPTVPNSTPKVEVGLNAEYAKEIWRLTNEERENAGLEPLAWNDTIAEVADIRAEEISTKFSHTRPDGGNVLADFNDIGVHGENLAYTSSPKDAMQMWMNSDGHRKAILDDRFQFKSMAVGCYVDEKGILWCVQLFSSDEIS